MGLPFQSSQYYFAIVNEKDSSIKVQKLRICMVHEKTLQKILEISEKSPNYQPRFEYDYHTFRWKTLKNMSQMYHCERESLGKIDICIPQYPSLESRGIESNFVPK